MSVFYINITFWKWMVLVVDTRWPKPMLIYPFSSPNTKQAAELTEKFLSSPQEIKYKIKYQLNYILLKYVVKLLYSLRIFQEKIISLWN